MKTTRYANELAITAQMFQDFNEHDSAIQSVDRMILMAEAFIEKYPLNTKWGIDEENKIDWEEALWAFFEANERKFIQTKPKPRVYES